MLLLFTILLVFIILSRIVETSTKIPSTLTLIVLSFILSISFPHILSISHEQFDEILYLMLPVILLPDILNISANELKKHYKQIIYLAVVAVIASIGFASFITPYILPQYQFTIGMLIALFSMLMATDAITVASIMSKFKLPEKLKIYAESESLFNDVTALIIFYFIALPMISGGEVTVSDINLTLIKVLFLSISIGVIIAFIGYYAIKILKNSFDQFLVIYLIVIISFMAAEHFEIAGILSIVASVLAFKYFVKKELLKNPSNINSTNSDDFESSLINLVKKVPALSKKDFREYKKESEYIGIFANAIVFVILANIVNFDLILKYYQEIIIIFALTSVIRFAAILPMIKKLNHPFRWSLALTFSGTKGALAIIMVHSLPADFIYKELFDSIVVGVVLLSTFLYTLFLMYHIKTNQNNYKLDIQNYDANSNNKQVVKDIVQLIEKDPLSKAYTQSFIEDIIEKELKRAQRYKTEFSSILIDPNTKNDKVYELIGKIVLSKIRINDYFGRFDDGKLIILTSNTSLSGAMVLAEKLEKIFKKELNIKNNNIHFGITQSGDNDTLSSTMEKLNDALNKIKNKQTRGNIEIEA